MFFGHRPLKIQILSDTHNECCNEPFIPSCTDADVVVLAGDIGHPEDSFRWAAEHFPGQRIVMVAGNHEAWGAEWHTLMNKMRIIASLYDIDFLENDMVNIAGVTFIGATLFTDMSLFGPEGYQAAIFHARLAMPDFQRIRLASTNRTLRYLGFSSLMCPEDSVELHKVSRQYIEGRLAERFNGPVVVVTHHAPSTPSVEKKFENNPLSPCFVSNLDKMIGDSNAALWVHGHTHTAFDYMINQTRVVCNAVGYRDHCAGKSPQEVSGFRPDLVVEV